MFGLGLRYQYNYTQHQRLLRISAAEAKAPKASLLCWSRGGTTRSGVEQLHKTKTSIGNPSAAEADEDHGRGRLAPAPRLSQTIEFEPGCMGLPIPCARFAGHLRPLIEGTEALGLFLVLLPVKT